MTNTLIHGIIDALSGSVSKEVIVFLISMIPILELRGALLVAGPILGVKVSTAIPLCIIGNIIPVPFILLLITPIFNWMKGTGIIFPIIHNGIAVDTFTPRIGPATRSAPRSSRIGIIEIRNTITSLLTLPLNASIIPCINVLVIRNSSYLFIYFFRNANIASISSLVPTVIRIYCSILSLPQKRT